MGIIERRICEDIQKYNFALEDDWGMDMYQAYIFMNVIEIIETFSNVDVITEEIEEYALKVAKEAPLEYSDVNETSYEIVHEVANNFDFEVDY